jgi:hypothetical protein
LQPATWRATSGQQINQSVRPRLVSSDLLRTYLQRNRSETRDHIRPFSPPLKAPSQSDRLETARKSGKKLRSYFGFIGAAGCFDICEYV